MAMEVSSTPWQGVPYLLPAEEGLPVDIPRAAQRKPVSGLDTTEKLKIALLAAAEHLGPDVADKIKSLLTAETLSAIAVGAAVLLAAQLIPGANAIVDLTLVGLAAYYLGSEAISVLSDLFRFVRGVQAAKTEADIERAGQHLSHAIAAAGVDVVILLLTRRAIKDINLPKGPPPSMMPQLAMAQGGVRVSAAPAASVRPGWGAVAIPMAAMGVTNAPSSSEDVKADEQPDSEIPQPKGNANDPGVVAGDKSGIVVGSGRTGPLTLAERREVDYVRLTVFNLVPRRAGSTDKTVGILQIGERRIPLVSGEKFPPGTGDPLPAHSSTARPRGTGSGYTGVTKDHVEAHAAATMHELGIKKATLYIDNGLCESCERLLSTMLPKGSKLTVVSPTGTSVHANP